MHSNNYAEWDALARIDAKTAILSMDGVRDEASFDEAGLRDADLVLSVAGKTGCVVDYGVGVGRVLRWVAPHFDTAVGLDVSCEMLSQCRTRVGARPVLQQVDGFGTMPGIADKSVDLAYSLLVLQHMDHYDAYRWLHEAYRVLKPDGNLVVQFPDVMAPGYATVYQQCLGARALSAGRMRLYTPDQVVAMLNQAGFFVRFMQRAGATPDMIVQGRK